MWRMNISACLLASKASTPIDCKVIEMSDEFDAKGEGSATKRANKLREERVLPRSSKRQCQSAFF